MTNLVNNNRQSIRLKYLFTERMGGAWGEDPENEGDGIVCLRAADFFTERLSHSKFNLTRRIFNANEFKSKHLKDGDLIIEKSGGGENQPVGRVIIYDLDEPALCSNFLELLRPNQRISISKFSAYLLHSLWLNRSVLPFIKQTTGIQNLDLKDYLTEKVFIPSLEEQKAIVEMLDRETARLDELIAEKVRLVELLVEKRRAIITHAVTRGLDENAKLKDSGIEWLDKIPEHWQAMKLKFACKLLRDGTHLPPPRVENGFPLLSVRNLVDGGYIRFLADDSKISEEDYLLLEKTFEVKENDILLAVVGATMGKVSLVPNLSNFAIQRSVAIFRTKPKIVHYKFFFYFFQSVFFQSVLWNNTEFSAQPGIYLGALANFSITAPPLEEQKKIVDFIEAETHKIDSLQKVTKSTIELLKERRSSLITAAVTGKIKVK